MEVQKNPPGVMNERLLYYTCRLLDRIGKRSKEWNYFLKPVYTICLMDYVVDGNQSLRSDYMLRDTSGNVLSEMMNIIIIRIPNIKAQSYEECVASYEKMLYLLKQMQGGMNRINELMSGLDVSLSLDKYTEEVCRRLLMVADETTLSPEEQDVYDYWMKLARDNKSVLAYAQEEGETKGIAKGLEEGIAKGKAEALLEVAKKMKAQDLPIRTISDCTGLDIPAIEAL